MADTAMRARMERLLRGEFHPEDLTRLFIYARDRNDGRECIEEIGDFVAHQSERDKGLITNAMKQWFLAVQFVVGQRGKYDLRSLPANFPDVMRASFALLPHLVIKEKAGMSKVAAKKVLPALIEKLVRNSDGTFSLTPQTHTMEEFKLAGCLSTMLAFAPAFDDKRLFSDFSACLKSLGILRKGDFTAFEKLGPVMSLFAIAAMHKSVVHVGGGASVTIRARVRKGGISVLADVPISSGSQHAMPTALFTASIPDLADRCEPQLLAMSPPWDCDLEMKRDMRLGVLG